MKTRIPASRYKAILIGGLSGAAVFFVLAGVRAASGLTVADIHANTKRYVGTTVQITGMAKDVRQVTKKINGIATPYTRINLYEVDSKGRNTKNYIYVALPTTAFASIPVDGQTASITGPLKWAYEIATIDP